MDMKRWIWLFEIIIFSTGFIEAQLTGLHLYVEEKPINVFDSITYSQQSFSFAIPDFNSPANSEFIEKIKTKIDSLSVETKFKEYFTTVQTKHKNVAVSLKATTNIIGNFDTLKSKLTAISAYRQTQNDNNSVRQTKCHADFLNVFGMPTLRAYDINLDVLINALNKDITVDQITTDEAEFKKYYQGLEQIQKITDILYYETENYLNGLESLAKFKLNNYIFELLQERECFATGPLPDFVELLECEFYANNVTCSVLVQNPQNRHKLMKLRPIPYFGYEIKMENSYLNKTSGQLVTMKCRNNAPVYSDCKYEQNSKCLQALQSKQLHNIFKECSFQQSKTKSPILTQNGILIPNDKVKVYSIISMHIQSFTI